MTKRLKKYCSVFFLLLFLFPFIEKQAHALEHATDLHCYSSDKHFHEAEHSCTVCDYHLPTISAAFKPAYVFFKNEHPVRYSQITEKQVSNQNIALLPTRAPPIL